MVKKTQPTRRLLSLITATASVLFFSMHTQAKEPATIDIPNTRIEVTVKKGDVVSTPCFRFTAKVDSLVQGSGCKIRALEQIGMPFIEIEVINDVKDKTLDQMGDVFLQAVAANLLKARSNQSVFKNPGPLDSNNEGRYFGKTKTTIDGLDALEFRWGVGDPNGISKKDNFRSIKVRTIVKLPANRFVWDGYPIGYLLMVGRERGFKSVMYNEARRTLDIY